MFMFFGDILSIENVRLDIRGNLLTLNSSVLIIGCSLFNYISFSPFVPTKGAKALHLVQLFVVAVAAVTASC